MCFTHNIKINQKMMMIMLDDMEHLHLSWCIHVNDCTDNVKLFTSMVSL